ncbi:esterase [Brachybacterium phenoliresistens]|uniref:Esterase n=1 Tax=Brachybacterium phenoliresistens TaxID=396014 RepID=Z9JVT2_9MICO|nr:alpha/beta hydrolase fold domain-containing protein [Brachybacterium phenoliresistens]EWS82088.1 esterase [Brachybacterium phenoliresistens]
MSPAADAAWAPQLAARAHLLEVLGPEDSLSPEAEAAWRAPFGAPESWDLDIVDRDLPGPHGRVPVRIYAPRPSGGAVEAADAGSAPARPALVWIHGGGFQHGDLDMPEAHEVSRGVAGRADAVVVSVFYRLCDEPSGRPAPNLDGETGIHAPIPLDDVHAAFTWVREHAAELGADPARIAVGGASAGGDLAACLSLRLAAEGAPPWQSFLMYPVAHIEMPAPDAEEAAALAACAPLGGFPAESVAVMGETYTGRPRSEATGYEFPALAARHDHLPPTLIDVAEFDGLRPSGRAYAQQLEAAGVEVELALSRGVPHGHLNKVGLAEAHASMDRMARRLRER